MITQENIPYTADEIKAMVKTCEKYNQALERARDLMTKQNPPAFDKHLIRIVFPELASEDDRIRKEIIDFLELPHPQFVGKRDHEKWIAWLEKQGESKDKGEISDGYHTFNELYRYRMLYNAAFFNMLPKEIVHKSKRHHDGEECFGGGWFVVMANLPTGQISNHYELKDWDLFQIPEKEIADEWDGHTPQEAAERLHKYLLEKQEEKEANQCSNCINDKGCVTCVNGNMKETIKSKFKEGDWVILNGTVAQILDKQKYGFVGLDIDGKDFFCNYGHTDSMHLWSIEDAKDGDVLSYVTDEEDLWIMIYWSLYEPYEGHVHYHALLVNDNFSDKGTCCICIDNLKPATKEQRNLLFQKMAEEGYVWDSEKKELKI